MFGLINTAAYLVFTIFSLLFLGWLLVGLAIMYPISLVGMGLAAVLLYPLLRWFGPFVRLLWIGLTGRPRR